MLERIKILSLLQWSNKSKLYEKHSKRIYAHLAIRAVIILFITIVVGLLLYFIKNMLYIPTNEYFLIALLILTQGLNIIVAISTLTSDLYSSKDNQILFSLPVKADEVYISKMIVYYIHEFIRNLYFVVPLLISFGFINKLGFLYYFNIIIVTIILPIFSVGIATLISIVVTFIKNFLRERAKLTFLIVIIMYFALFFLVYLAVNKIPTPIRIVQLYNRFIISLTMTLYKVASVGTIYTIIGKFLFSFSYFLNLGIIILSVAAVALINYLIAKPAYFRLMSSSNENTVKKVSRKKPRETKSLFMSFVRKEFTIARRTPNELLNNYSTLLILPFIMYVLNYIYMGINRSTLGNQFVLIFNIFISLVIVTAANTASATAITTEGYEFILLKTAPYNTSKIAWAKIIFNIVFTIIMIGISFILFSLALPVFPKENIWLLFVFVVIVNTGHILSSFQIDLLNPKLSDYASQGTLSHNTNISKSLANGLGEALIYFVLSLLLFVFVRGAAWYILLSLAAIITTYRFIMFNRFLNAYFEDIEY